MEELAFELHESLISLSSLLSSQPPGFDIPVPGHVMHGSTLSYASLSSASSSRDDSSSFLGDRRPQGSGYEIRRAARRLDRVTSSIGAQIKQTGQLSLNDDRDRHVLQNHLVTIVTDLAQAIETFFLTGAVGTSDDVWSLYNKTAMEACQILLKMMQGCDLVHESEALHPTQIGGLLGRVAKLLFWKRSSVHSSNTAPPQEPRLLGSTVTLVNTSICLGGQIQGVAELHLPLKPLETLELLQLVIPPCMESLLVRWNAFELDGQNQERVQLRVLVGFLLQHLSNQIAAELPDNPAKDEGRVQDWLACKFAVGSEGAATGSHKALRFMETCRDFGVELTEYALDVLDGASLVLSTTGNSPSVYTAAQYAAVLQDALDQVDLGKNIAEILNDGMGWKVPLRALFVAFASFVASPFHQALAYLDKQEQQHEDLEGTRKAAGEKLVALARTALTQNIVAGNHGHDLGMENAVAIALLRGMEVPEASHDIKCILEDFSAPCLSQPRSDELRPSKKQKCDQRGRTAIPFRTQNMSHVLQAASMSSLVLPNHGAMSPPNRLSKQHQVTSLVQAASTLSTEKSSDPWKSLLFRKLSDEGTHSSPIMGTLSW